MKNRPHLVILVPAQPWLRFPTATRTEGSSVMNGFIEARMAELLLT